MAKLTLGNLSPESRAKLDALMNRMSAPPERGKTTYIPPVRKSPADYRVKKPVDPYVEKVRPVQEWLIQTWPNLFDLKHPKPLKRHIDHDITPHLPPEITKTQLRRALAAYTGREVYLKAILTNGWRHDLTGAPLEEIPETQKIYTTTKKNRKIQRRLDEKNLKYGKDKNNP